MSNTSIITQIFEFLGELFNSLDKIFFYDVALTIYLSDFAGVVDCPKMSVFNWNLQKQFRISN